VEIVAEDFADVTYLRELHSSGFELFYGVGLPRQAVIFLGSGRGFIVEDNPDVLGFRSLTSKAAENLYYRLLWCRFGHAVSLCGWVKERNLEQSLFCLHSDRGREVWCRLRGTELGQMPDVGQKVSVFAWEKWVTPILDVIQLEWLRGEEPVSG